MPVKVGSDNAQASALARFFSSTVLGEMARKGSSPTLIRLARESLLLEKISVQNKIGKLFDAAFHLLKATANRHEYVYKAALTQRILLGTHSLQTASMLTEFRVGKCKADLVILNGTATAYEIKSERDSLTRLSQQVETYRRVFAKVYVIAGENHVQAIFDGVPGDVGILVLSGRHRISTRREAIHCPQRTSPLAIFDSLRLSEAKLVLEGLGIEVPTVPNTEMYQLVRTRFADLPPVQAHAAMVSVLKKSRQLLPLSSMINELPTSLHAAALSTPLRVADRSRLIRAVHTSIDDALSWG